MTWVALPHMSKDEHASVRKQIQGRARVLVDENVHIGVAATLRGKHYNVRTVEDVGLTKRSDELVFRYARKHGRVILTHDPDFLDNRRFPLRYCPGVVILPGGDGDWRAVWRGVIRFAQFARHSGRMFHQAKMDICSDGSVTLRTLDGESGAIDIGRYRFAPNGAVEVWE